MRLRLLSDAELPEGFSYPGEFLRAVRLGLVNLEPWTIVDGEHLRRRFAGLRERYPTRTLVPFAERQDNDDVACWDADHGGVTIVHDFASPGWEQRWRVAGFHEWLRL